jgi:23S rRNA pseudouridine2605 synthase
MSRKPPAAEARDKERIAKVMARAGLCSRRDAEAWIVAGRVAVNGERLASPAFTVSPRDRIEVDGKPLPGRERTRLFLYHKPKGLVTTNRDERGRPTIFGALPKHLPRLVTVGRLDINSEGLLLLTNDGGLARALELPETGWLRRYRVRANGRVTQEMLDRLSRGMTVEGIKYGPIQATLDREQGANVWLTLGLREGKNREVRNVLRELGLSVNRLIRVSYGPFQLRELAPAAVEEVTMRVLREQIGEKVERRAGADFSAPLREGEDELAQKPPRPSPGKAPRSASSSPPTSGRWKNKRNAARSQTPRR